MKLLEAVRGDLVWDELGDSSSVPAPKLMRGRPGGKNSSKYLLVFVQNHTQKDHISPRLQTPVKPKFSFAANGSALAKRKLTRPNLINKNKKQKVDKSFMC